MSAEILKKSYYVRLILSARTHKLLRRVAASADTSMMNYAHDQLTRHLEEEAKRRSIKV